MRLTDRTLVIKLGGSVVTDKKRSCKADRSSIHRIAIELAKRKEHLIILNGAGSFGHISVRRHGLDHGFRAQNRKAFAKTKLQLLRLQEIIGSILCEHGIPVVPLNASSFMLARSGDLTRVDLTPIRALLRLRLVPLFGGDLIPDIEQGWSVISADQMASWIAPRVKASMVIYGTDVDGLYESDPALSKEARLIQLLPYNQIATVATVAKGSRMPDVTHGMRGKLLEAQNAARRGVPVIVMNLKRPKDLHLILGGRLGRWTTILPRRKSE